MVSAEVIKALAYPTSLFPPPEMLTMKPFTLCGALLDQQPAYDISRDPKARSLQSFIDAEPNEKPVLISLRCGMVKLARSTPFTSHASADNTIFGLSRCYWLHNDPCFWPSSVDVRQTQSERQGLMLVQLAIGALAVSGRRGILVRGTAGLSSSHLDPSSKDIDLLIYARAGVYELDGPIPYSWLLPRCSVLVHSGGGHITAAALHAGLPQVILPPSWSCIILPESGQQWFWAVKAADVGVGFETPISPEEVTIEQLAGMIVSVSTDDAVMRAKKAAVEAAKENGVERLMRLIEREAARGGAFWDEIRSEAARAERRRTFRGQLIMAGFLAGVGAMTFLIVRRLAKSHHA